MSNWYTKVTNDLSAIPDLITHFEQELSVAASEIKISGNVEKNLAALPGLTEYRFNQLQEIEAILNFLNIKLKKVKRGHFQKYLESYNRALSSREAEKYVEGEQEVIDYEILVNEVALLRNRFLGVMKGLESKNFMLGHLIRLRTAGMEDLVVS